MYDSNSGTAKFVVATCLLVATNKRIASKVGRTRAYGSMVDNSTKCIGSTDPNTRIGTLLLNAS